MLSYLRMSALSSACHDKLLCFAKIVHCKLACKFSHPPIKHNWEKRTKMLDPLYYFVWYSRILEVLISNMFKYHFFCQAEELATGRDGESTSLNHCISFPCQNLYIFLIFDFVDGRADYGPGRSKGGGIYVNGQ